MRPCNSFSVNICFEFSVLCLGSAVNSMHLWTRLHWQMLCPTFSIKFVQLIICFLLFWWSDKHVHYARGSFRFYSFQFSLNKILSSVVLKHIFNAGKGHELHVFFLLVEIAHSVQHAAFNPMLSSGLRVRLFSPPSLFSSKIYRFVYCGKLTFSQSTNPFLWSNFWWLFLYFSGYSVYFATISSWLF